LWLSNVQPQVSTLAREMGELWMSYATNVKKNDKKEYIVTDVWT